ncbi:ESX secretion-associated protein EspG [Amycolatopsis rubida]|uniref:EspG family protein n=1 Tax=Amycolatopsis rubida TaxID=112413 RepID=A0A1I5EZJ2_9PSEU|nr:ESX secretion-associated protein EspG [Amycolatopsis rubida]SFO16887.1 EspG family protein [Amycolatopsis rubida]
MLLDGPVALPRLAVAKAWEWERIGPTHPVLGIVDVWVEDGAAARLDDLTRQVLAEPGFYNLRTGRVTGEFRDLMLAIANADAECYGWSADRHGRDRALLAVLTGRSAVLATVEDEQLTLTAIGANQLVRAVVDGLPDFPAANINEITVPKAEYDRGQSNDSYTLDTSSDYTVTSPVDQLRALMTSRREASHQLFVAARTGSGRSASMPLTAVDSLDHGRVLTYLRDNAHGEVDIACGPGNPEYITGTLENTLRLLRG